MTTRDLALLFVLGVALAAFLTLMPGGACDPQAALPWLRCAP